MSLSIGETVRIQNKIRKAIVVHVIIAVPLDADVLARYVKQVKTLFYVTIIAYQEGKQLLDVPTMQFLLPLYPLPYAVVSSPIAHLYFQIDEGENIFVDHSDQNVGIRNIAVPNGEAYRLEPVGNCREDYGSNVFWIIYGVYHTGCRPANAFIESNAIPDIFKQFLHLYSQNGAHDRPGKPTIYWQKRVLRKTSL